MNQPSDEQIPESKPLTGDDINMGSNNETLRSIVNALVPLFKIANIFVFASICIFFASDMILLWNKTIDQSHRIIDKTVVIALITAVASELSVIIIATIKKMN